MGCRNSHACHRCSILTTQSVLKEGSQNRILMTCMVIRHPTYSILTALFMCICIGLWEWGCVRGQLELAWPDDGKDEDYELVNDILVFHRCTIIQFDWDPDFWTPIFGPRFLDPDFWTPIFGPRFLDPDFWTPIFGPRFLDPDFWTPIFGP